MNKANIRGICNLICFPCWVAAHFVHSVVPFWVVTIFWVLNLIGILTCLDEVRYWFTFCGAALNCVVMLANHGMMPVIDESIKKAEGVWRPALTGDHLLFLADRFAGFSIGDFILIGSVLAFYLIKKLEAKGA